MPMIFTEKSNDAVDRYGFFLNILRSQAETVFRRGPTDEGLRNDAEAIAKGAARSYLQSESDIVQSDTEEVAIRAQNDAQRDLEAVPEPLTDRLRDFADDSAYYLTRILAAQAERDVVTMAQHNQQTAMRIDRYVRSGRHTASTAAAQVMIEDNNSPAFRFIDRMGRKYKASKHIRDIYRQALMNVYNEVYADVVASYGRDTVFVQHPDPNYKWNGVELVIVTGSSDDSRPLYYDVRDEIFHPSSQATITARVEA